MPAARSCPTAEQWQAFVAKTLSPSDQELLKAHLSVCPTCQQQVKEQPPSTPETFSFLQPTSTAGILGRLGKYEIQQHIGTGSMGVVLKARDSSLQRTVALKVLKPGLAHEGVNRQRFVREARALAAIQHENVIAVYEVVEDGRTPYLAMEYVEGRSLQAKLQSQGALELKEILRIGQQIALGLAAAHHQGIIHRDVKPANILLENSVERVKISDFGLAFRNTDVSLTHHGTFVGTPEYASPEQARGEPTDHRSDLFSLGSVLYAMCVGQSPFRSSTSDGVLEQIQHRQPPSVRELNHDIPEWLDALIIRLHAKAPQERFTSASEVAELLQSRLQQIQMPSARGPQPQAPQEHRGSGAKNLLIKIAAALVLGMSLVYAGTFLIPSREGASQRQNTNSAGVPAHSQDQPKPAVIPESQAAQREPLIKHFPPTIVGAGPDAAIGFHDPVSLVFDESEPALRLDQTPANPNLLITRLAFCVQDTINRKKRADGLYTGDPRDVHLWIPPKTGANTTAVVLDAESTHPTLVRPARPLPDGVYCLHTVPLSANRPPEFCVPFVVRGIGKPIVVRVTVDNAARPLILRFTLRNDGRGEFNDGYVRITLQKVKAGTFGDLKAAQNINLPIIAAGAEEEITVEWMTDALPAGEYYFHGHMTDHFLRSSVNTRGLIESEVFSLPGPGSRRDQTVPTDD